MGDGVEDATLAEPVTLEGAKQLAQGVPQGTVVGPPQVSPVQTPMAHGVPHHLIPMVPSPITPHLSPVNSAAYGHFPIHPPPLWASSPLVIHDSDETDLTSTVDIHALRVS